MKPRLLLVAYMYPDAGGITSIVDNIAATFADGYEIHLAIVVERPGRTGDGPVPESNVHVLGQSSLIWPGLMPTSLLFTLRVSRFLSRVLAEVRPVAMIVQDGLFLPAPAAWARRGTDSRLAVMDHGTLTNLMDPEYRRINEQRMGVAKRAVFRLGFALDAPWRALRWRWGLSSADVVWFVGDEVRPFAEKAGARYQRYSQIVPPDFVPPSGEERADARRLFGAEPGESVFNVVSRLEGEKGLDTIIEAFARARDADPNRTFSVLVAGEGTLRTWFEREAARRGLGDSVRLLGRLDRDSVRTLQHASDFHVYAGTISCGMSICLLEAMASGVVPIASDVPVAQRALVGEAGWVFPAGDAGVLSGAIQAALRTSDGDLARLRRAAVERLSESGDPPLRRLVDDLVQDGPSSRALRAAQERLARP